MVRKIYTKKTENKPAKLVAKVHGKNLIEIKKKGNIYKITGNDFSVVANYEDNPEEVTVLTVENGELLNDENSFDIVEEKEEDEKKEEK